MTPEQYAQTLYYNMELMLGSVFTLFISFIIIMVIWRFFGKIVSKMFGENYPKLKWLNLIKELFLLFIAVAIFSAFFLTFGKLLLGV